MKENKVLSLNDFLTLLLVHLANNSEWVDKNNPKNKYACIPFAYKEIIQNILCAENGWKEKFSVLINVDEYFDNHFIWEMNMSDSLDTLLTDLGKTVVPDFQRDQFVIAFTDSEVSQIMKKYSDVDTNDVMEHFARLLNDFIYTRRFKEEFINYSSKSVEHMKLLRRKEVSRPFERV